MRKSENGEGIWKKRGTSAGFAKLIFILVLSVTVSKSNPRQRSSRGEWLGVQIGLNVSEGKNIGEWCEVRHTMCDARHKSVHSVTLVTASVTLVTGTTLVLFWAGLGLCYLFPFYSFLHLLFFPFSLLLQNGCLT